MAGRRSFALVIRRSEVESFIRDVCRAAQKFMELFRDELFFFLLLSRTHVGSSRMSIHVIAAIIVIRD